MIPQRIACPNREWHPVPHGEQSDTNGAEGSLSY